MSLAKGFVLSLLGAALAAAVWVGVIMATGWNAWLICPIVGGGAGLGMMWGTKMRGGLEAGLLAAVAALLCIGAARYVVVADVLADLTQASEDDLIDDLAWTVASEWESEGYEVLDDDEDLLPEVYAEAERRWFMMTESERAESLAAAQAEGEDLAAAATPWALLFDFGIFGTVCTCLTLGTALKTGSTTLEATLAQKGKASGAAETAALAARLRAGERIEEGPLAGLSGAAGGLPGAPSGAAPKIGGASALKPVRAQAQPRPSQTSPEAPGEGSFRLPVSEPPKTARRAIMTATDEDLRSAA